MDNIMNVLKCIKDFSVIEDVVSDRVKSMKLTKMQTRVICFILEGKNWMLTKTAIAKCTGVSRLSVDTCFNILEVIYDEVLNSVKKE